MVGGVDPGGGGLCSTVAMEPVLSAALHDWTTMKRKTLVEKVKGLSLCSCVY